MPRVCAHALTSSISARPTPWLWCYAQLFDVGRPVDLVHQHVADRLIAPSDGDPGPAPFHIASQHFDGGGLVVSDVVEPVLPEALARRALDHAEHRQVTAAGRTNRHVGHRSR